MASVVDAFRQAFRDYVTDGVPSSGSYFPGKAALRALGSAIETFVTGLITDQTSSVATERDARILADNLEATARTSGDNAAGTRLTALEQNAVSGYNSKAPVRTIATANVVIASGLVNGAALNGLTLATGDRVLLPAQTTASENGVYVVAASGAASRAADANTADGVLRGAYLVLAGTVDAGTVYALSTPGPITLGTTSLAYVKVQDGSALLSSVDAKLAPSKADVAVGQRSLAGGTYEHARVQNMAAYFAFFDSNTGTRFQWLIPAKMGADDRVDAVRFTLNDEGRGPATIEVDTYLQPAALASAAQITTLAGYQLIDNFSAGAASYFTVGGGLQTVTIPIKSAPYLTKGQRIVCVVRLKDGSGNLLAMSMGYSRFYTNDGEAFEKGGFTTASGGALTSVSAISADNRIFGEFLARRAAEKPAEQGSAESRPSVRLVPVQARRKGSQWGSDFTRISFHERPAKGIAAPGALELCLTAASAVRAFRLRAFTRPFADGDFGSSFTLGTGNNDRQVFARDYIAADLMSIQSVFAGEEQFVQFDLMGMPSVAPDQIVAFELSAYDTDKVTPRTFRVAQAQDSVPTALLGGYSTASPASSLSRPSYPHHGVILEAVRLERASIAGGLNVTDRAQFLDRVAAAQSTPTALALPRIALSGLSRSHVFPAQTVAIDALPAVVAKTDAINMRYNQWDALSARFWSGTPVVTRTSDSAVLTAGTDYEVEAGSGRIRGLQNIADTPVTVTMQAYKIRIDLVVLAPWDITGTGVTVFKGTEQFADPDNWRPNLSSISANGRIALCEVLVRPDALEVIDLTGFNHRSKVAIGRESEIDAIKRWNADQLAPARLALQRGQAITWIPYGDSNTGCGGGTEPAYQTTPGGPSRDRRDHLTIQTADASLAQMGTPASDGPAGAGMHWYGSWNARTCQTLRDRFGVTVAYKNLGIGGTTTKNEGSGTEASRYGGSHPTRLAGILAAKGSSGVTIVCIGFGANEDDDELLINNLTVIGRYCLSNGMIPIFVGQPMLGQSQVRTPGRQKRNEERVVRAARSVPAAVVPFGLIAHEQRGASGIFPTLQATAGGTNHPGIWEHAKYAEWIDELCFKV